MCFTINGRPRPINGESYRGYLLRLVDQNGFKSISSLTRSLGCNFISSVNLLSKSSVKLIELIEPVLKMNSGQLLGFFEKHWSFDVYASNDVNLRRLFHKHARICPFCIEEQCYSKADWDFAFITTCKKHQCLLIDTCPHCLEQISWKRPELHLCHCCERDFSEYTPTKLASNDPLLQLSALVKARNTHIQLKVLAICSRMHRPYDNLLATPSLDQMSLNELVNLFRKVMGLKLSKKYRDGYIEDLRLVRKHLSVISDDAVIEPYEAFKEIYPCRYKKDSVNIEYQPSENQLDSIEVGTIVKPVELANKIGVKLSRISNLNGRNETTTLMTQIDSNRLAHLLHIPYVLIKSLLKDGFIKPINNVESFQHAYFDLNEIVALLTPLPLKVSDTNTYIRLIDLLNEKDTVRFGLHFHHVMEYIFKGQLKLYQEGENNGLLQYFVEREQLYRLLHQSMINSRCSKTIAELAPILCTSPSVVIKLHELGVIDVNNFWQRGDSEERTIIETSYHKILTDYLSLNRMCHFTGVSISDALSLLKSNGIKPDIIARKNTKVLYFIYKNSFNYESIRQLMLPCSLNKYTYDGYSI